MSGLKNSTASLENRIIAAFALILGFTCSINHSADVSFGIHPVAGRIPGHMNVLLAKANIAYNKLKEMDQINAEFGNTDVVIKRTLSPGFAGIPNPLFAVDNTLMPFGDGKKVMDELVTAFNEA